MKLKTVGSVVKGKIITCGKEVDGLGDRYCQVALDDGSFGYLGYGDIVWDNWSGDIDDPQYFAMIDEIAETFIGKEVRCIVLNDYQDKIILGRKHMWPDPFLFLAKKIDLIVEGAVISLFDNAAKVFIDKVNQGDYDYIRLFGILPESVCPKSTWEDLKEGQRLKLKIGPSDIENRALLLAPLNWRSRYKRGRKIRGKGCEIEISAEERSLLKYYAQCENCKVRLEQDLLDTLISVGYNGEDCKKMLFRCPQCNEYYNSCSSYKIAHDYLKLLKEGNPNLVEKLIKVF